MKFRRVNAKAFGPLTDAELEFGEGLTIVWGPNEAAKSSWHSAMYAALCGRRRRSGRSVADEDFRARHQPWDGDCWAVSADIDLDDGRHVSISRDLANRQSDVLDVTLGRAVDDEIMHEGSPDGALWLGLDRTTFLSTACIRQAEIAAVTASPDGLKHLLQQAASTLGGDVTASDALLALSNFRKDNVGQDRANAVKPLRLANEAVTVAESKLGLVQRRQQEYLTLVVERESTRAATGAAQQALTDVEVSVQRGRHREEVRRSQQLTELLAGLPATTDSVVSSTELDQLERLLAQWSTLTSSSSAEPSREVGAVRAEIAALRQELDLIPDQPAGDVTIAEPVREAHSALESACAATVLSSSPSDFSGPELDVLREAHRLASLAQAPGPADEGITLELDAARASAAARHQQLRIGAVARIVGGGALLVSVALGLAGLLSVAAGVAALSVVGFGVFWWSRQLNEVPVAELEARLRGHKQALEAHRAQARAAVEFLSKRGLPFDLDQIRELVEARAVADANRARLVLEQKYHHREVQLCQDGLADALVQRGVAIDTSSGSPDSEAVDQALGSYLDDVTEAALVAEQRRGIEILAQRLRHNIETEQRMIERAQSQERILSELRAVVDGHRSAKVGVDASSPSSQDDDASVVSQAEVLLESGRAARRIQVEHARISSRVDAITEGSSIDEVLSQGETAVAALGSNDDGPVADAVQRDRAALLLSQAAQTEAAMVGRLEMIDAAEVDVPSTEAALAQAERELERVQRLAVVLDRTSEHLGLAEEQAFRVVAPRLAAEVSAVLPIVTSGRYVEAMVDPESLSVKVTDAAGRFRDAGALSHGTTEQIYLLLRIAMAKILTNPIESCPIIIDDSTVHADQERTEALLAVLRDASLDTQIVIFTQEQHVLEWAKSNLTDRDHLVELEPV